MLRPPQQRTLVTAPSSQAPLRVAAVRRASPLQSGAVALGEHRGRQPGRSERVCLPRASPIWHSQPHAHDGVFPVRLQTDNRQTVCLLCQRIHKGYSDITRTRKFLRRMGDKQRTDRRVRLAPLSGTDGRAQTEIQNKIGIQVYAFTDCNAHCGAAFLPLSSLESRTSAPNYFRALI